MVIFCERSVFMATAAENKSIKRRSILDAATRLFTDKSVAETAIDEVVQLAGVAKGTFYLYFRDKYDLFDQIVLHRTAEVFAESCKSLRDSIASPAEQFMTLADNIAAYLQKNKKVTALIDRRFSACLTQPMQEENEDLCGAVEHLTDLLSVNVSREEARRQLYILIDMIGSVCCSTILNPHPYGPDEILPTLHTMLYRFFGGGELA